MKHPDRTPARVPARAPACIMACALACILGLGLPMTALALLSDRQQPLEVNADSTVGTLGDGTATLKGNVEIRQGSLLIRADLALVEKVDGRVRRVILNGEPVHLQQEIEDAGLVSAEARKIVYEVATGIVTLTGAADVVHPQYRISGDQLEYDMNLQHFQGSGGDENGRIRIQLDPEVVSGAQQPSAPDPTGDAESPPSANEGTDDAANEPAGNDDGNTKNDAADGVDA